MSAAKLLAIVQALSLAHDLYLKFQRGALTPEQLETEWDKMQVNFDAAVEAWEEAGRVAEERGF